MELKGDRGLERERAKVSERKCMKVKRVCSFLLHFTLNLTFIWVENILATATFSLNLIAYSHIHTISPICVHCTECRGCAHMHQQTHTHTHIIYMKSL